MLQIKARSPFSILFLQVSLLSKKSYYHRYFSKMIPNIQIESSSKPLLTVDEVEKVQCQRVASLVSNVFQLTYAAILDSLIQEAKVNRCCGCAIDHPSQRQHPCLMMDSKDAWIYYHDDVVEQINLNVILKTAESVCSALGFNLSKRGKRT